MITNQETLFFYGTQFDMENVHNHMYAMLLKTYVPKDKKLNKLLDYLNDISNSINAIKNFINGIGERGQELVDIIKNDQNCSASNSSFFSCMATAAVNKLTNKAVSKINNKIQNATNDITNQITNKITQSGGVFDNIVNRQANAIDKITKQVNILL